MTIVVPMALPLLAALIPGLRTWLAITASFGLYVWLTWPSCELGHGDKCSLAYQLSWLTALVAGGALLARGGQIAFLPSQRWWVRILVCLAGMVIGYVIYGTFFS
ncbi:hypothetical protein ASC89_21750 [Devosia sp. Root413D1]|uniref:hypothetical protein n=1 Tax=unclassified Devosia TaxID=196773 RepID=UPI0006FD8B78|nr:MULTISPECIES: hypothetical protein [unclassified Devosia]KQU93851.1 hypothetical protein ASC68_19360 [Devosia sp. Root105]KQW75571.1 hypothetical protein ASC89_21750 [Devosia sp. Root413D1]